MKGQSPNLPRRLREHHWLADPRQRRITGAIVTVCALVAVFGVRLVEIQVVRADEYNAAAGERVEVQGSRVPGARGSILDRDGDVLAASVPRFDLTVSPKDAKPFEREVDGTTIQVSREQAAAEIATVTGQTAEEVVAVIAAALETDAESNWAMVRKAMTREQFERIDAMDIPWTYFEERQSRSYPRGSVAGNLVGFVGSEGEAQAGVELQHDACLTGEDGSTSYVRSRDGVPLPGTRHDTAPRNGSDVVLTIDAELQWLAQQSLARRAVEVGARWGIATVMEVATGKLLAVAEYPSADPGDISASAPEDRGSRAFSAPFEPGSTYKTLTAAALIEEGAAGPGSEILSPYRYIAPNDADINDTDLHGDLRLTLTGVMVQSSNTGISQLGERLSPETRAGYFTKFGQDRATEVGFPGESGGILADVDAWDNQTTYTTMFGQGFSTTAIQGASLYQAIANNGVRMPVRLVEGCRAPDGGIDSPELAPGERVLSESAAQQVGLVLEAVDRESWVADQVAIPGYRVAMKTSTAQQPDGSGGYSKSYLVSMAGFAPVEAPRYVVTVNLADPVDMNNSAAAAPVFRELMSYALRTGEVLPSTTDAPDLPLDY
ncbi:peptidoglycan D,D-transpeptidase FtsI family protein [Plantibacter sp. YIM 135249]|uniref:peptidoglycan D,D-transpeptidase FtsI family protein n=1 Tax=Plantibacter sp. YIM 135249 TaxID=3423918 RepID=UPI003D342068